MGILKFRQKVVDEYLPICLPLPASCLNFQMTITIRIHYVNNELKF